MLDLDLEPPPAAIATRTMPLGVSSEQPARSGPGEAPGYSGDMAALRWWEIVALTAAALALPVAIAGAMAGDIPGWIPGSLAMAAMAPILILAAQPGRRHRRGRR